MPVSRISWGLGAVDCSPMRMIAVSVANNPVLKGWIDAINVVSNFR